MLKKSGIKCVSALLEFAVLFCAMYAPLISYASTTGDQEVEKIGESFGYGCMCLQQRLGENYQDPEAKKFGEWVGRKLQGGINTVLISVHLGAAAFGQDRGAQCDNVISYVRKLYLQAGLTGRVWEQASKQKKHSDVVDFQSSPDAPEAGGHEIDSNIDDLGFTLGYVSHCANNPGEASSLIFDWFIGEWGTQHLSAFGSEFEKGEQAYKKGNGRNCERLRKRVHHILNKIPDITFGG